MATTLPDLLPLLSRIAEERDRAHSLTELAAAADRSPSYFQRAFRRLVGESPKRYDKRLRLEWAAVLLLTTNDSVLHIALRVGFGSHEGFTREFHTRYGLAPRAFRDRGVDADESSLARHAELVRHIGPCLGLFRVELAAKPKPLLGDPMSYDISLTTLDAQPFLFRAAQCEQSAIAETLGTCLGAVSAHVTRAGYTMVGPPLTRYVSWGPGLISLEAGLPVAPGANGEGDIQLGELPAGRAVTTVHTGPYDGLGDAHAAVEKWIAAEELEVAGAPWEVYLTDPGEVPNPDEWMTQIVWPVQS